MKFHDYNVVIERKKIKHLYARIKDPGVIYITCSSLTPKRFIMKFLKENEAKILKMIKKYEIEQENENTFRFLGTEYEVIFNDAKAVILSDNVVYAKDERMLNKWLKDQTVNIFGSRLDLCYNKINFKCPYPSLKIRMMKTRWGVCHHHKKSITLNSKLIRYDLDVIDYVIFHELCHFKYQDHQAKFWDLVSEYVPNYKLLKKKLRE